MAHSSASPLRDVFNRAGEPGAPPLERLVGIALGVGLLGFAVALVGLIVALLWLTP